MKSYIGTFVNRETEQALINVITSYCDTHWCKCSVRLKIFIRKSREIGMIYAEKYGMYENFVSRRYLTPAMWVGQISMFADKAMEHMCTARFYLKLAGLSLPITKLIDQIEYQNYVLASF